MGGSKPSGTPIPSYLMPSSGLLWAAVERWVTICVTDADSHTLIHFKKINKIKLSGTDLPTFSELFFECVCEHGVLRIRSKASHTQSQCSATELYFHPFRTVMVSTYLYAHNIRIHVIFDFTKLCIRKQF